MSAVEEPTSLPPPRQPQDHLKPAAQLEAEGSETVDIEYEGITFTIAASMDDWDLDTLEAFETGKGVAMIRGVLGVEGLAETRKTFAKAHGRKMRVKDLRELGDVIAQAMGLESAGE